MKTANWLTAVLVVAAFCLLPTAYCFGQDTPGTVKCPSSQDSLDSLFRVADSPRAKLLTAIDASATSMTVTSTSAFPATGSLKINEEIIYYTGKTSDTFSGLVRGASGTTAAGHVSNSDIFAPIIAAHHNALASAIVCVQGIAMAAVPNTRVVNGHALNADVTVTKSDVGLGDADNTSDANKPVSAATQTALDAKVPNTRTVNSHALSVDVTVTKSDVGLGNADNTSDANKPVSTAQQTALDAKVPTTRAVNGHPLSSDVTVTKSDVGLGNVVNLDATNPSNIDQDSTHRFATDAEKSTWNAKQDALGYTAENTANRRTSFQVTPDDSHYASEKLVKDSLDAKQNSLGYTAENSANKDTDAALAANSDTKYASQKAVKAYADTKVAANGAISGATKTKITYDAKGLVTAGADASTADISDSTDKRYVTDAQRTVIQNTSGTNTGDQDLSALATKAAIQIGSYNSVVDAGSSDSYAGSLSPSIASYTNVIVWFKANTANTGAATLNLNSVGAVTIKKQKDQDLADNDIKAGQWVLVAYDGTNWQMLSPVSNAASSGIASVNGDTSSEQTVNAADASLIKTDSGATHSLALPYKLYVATVTQSSTGDPVATVATNTTGGTLTWARTGQGTYTVTASGAAFTADKTFITFGPLKRLGPSIKTRSIMMLH